MKLITCNNDDNNNNNNNNNNNEKGKLVKSGWDVEMR